MAIVYSSIMIGIRQDLPGSLGAERKLNTLQHTEIRVTTMLD
jgi:hypothetical protein